MWLDAYVQQRPGQYVDVTRFVEAHELTEEASTLAFQLEQRSLADLVRARGDAAPHVHLTDADNAAAESLFASLKREILPNRHGWPTARAARLAVFRRLGFYNHRRRHSAIGYLARVAFEQRSTTLAIAA